MPYRPLNADDIFISYTRRDASTYANGLADELGKRNLHCYLDALGTEPSADLPESLKRRIRNSQMFVLVCTRRAGQRETIRKEIEEFLKTGRKQNIVPVDINGSFYKASWLKLVEGVNPATETSPLALKDGRPSPQVVERIDKQYIFRRGDERRQLIERRAKLVLAGLLIFIAVATSVAGYQSWRAVAETKKVERAAAEARQALAQAQAAREEAETARAAAETAKDQAKKQKDIADLATNDAQEKTKLASAAALRAKEAGERADREQRRAEHESAIAEVRAGANRSQSYLRQRPEDVRGSLSYAVDAMKKAERIAFRNADADAALRESLALLPLHRSIMTFEYAPPKQVAISPDGRYCASVTNRTLRVYLAADDGAGGPAQPVLERPCDCSAVALSSGLNYALAALNEGGFKMFDLKDDSRSRVIKSLKIAGDNEITGWDGEFALSPDGQYLAIYGAQRKEELYYSALYVFDTASGGLVKIFDDAAAGDSARDIALDPAGKLNMIIHDVAFGPTGSLAVAGGFGGLPAGRVIIWPLSAGARSKLTADSFKEYQVIPLENLAEVIAPGADVTYFATEWGVWKKPLSQTGFEPVARFPPPADGNISTVHRMAFRPDGRSLVLARRLAVAPQGAVQSQALEVWDSAGHTEQAEAFLDSDAKRLGFEPGGHLVAAINDIFKLNGATPGETRPRRLHVYDGETGAEAVAAEPDPEDDGVIYVSPDAAYVVTLSRNSAQVWDVWAKDEAKRTRRVDFGGVLESVNAVALGWGGHFLALTGPADGTNRVIIYRFDRGAYAEVRRFASPPPHGVAIPSIGMLFPMALSADGRRLIVNHNVYDNGTENVALSKRLEGEAGESKYALSADGRYLAVSDRFGITPILKQTARTRLFDTATGSWETLLGDGDVRSMAFSPDGAYLGVGSTDGLLRVFKTAKSKWGGAKHDAHDSPKEEVARLQLAGAVTAVAFSDDGKYVATASSQPRLSFGEERVSYPLRVWLLCPSDLIAEAERRLGREAPSVKDGACPRPSRERTR